MSVLTRVALAAALIAGAGATAASAQPDPPGPYPCYVRWEPWIAWSVDGLPNVDRPTLECLY